jgi:Pyridoxal-dependent decarboxylase, pyridoxal binding domain
MTISDTIRLVRVRTAVTADDESLTTIGNEPDVVAACRRWRRAFRYSAIAFPATVLTLPDAANWIRAHRCEVDAHSPQGIAFAMSASIPLKRVMFHCANATDRTITDALDAGIGQFIVDSESRAVKLGACAVQPLPVLVDVTDLQSGAVTALSSLRASGSSQAVRAEEYLDLAGVYREAGTPEDAVLPALEIMAELRVRDHILPSRLAVALHPECSTSPESLAEALSDAVEEGCARYRLPRPALTVFPDWTALTHGV